MGGTTRRGVSRRYIARLLDGPLQGTFVRMAVGPDDEPTEVFPIASEHDGAYVLAGSPGSRGVLPYRWITVREWAGLRRWLRVGQVAERASTPPQGRLPRP